MKLIELLTEMPEVYRGNGIKMKIYFNDTDMHHVPHIHIQQQNHEIVVSLLDLSILVDNPKFHKRLKRLALQIIKSQLPKFKNDWNTNNPNKKI